MGQKLRELRFATFDELLSDVQSLRQRGYERGGKWDLPMIEDHLARSIIAPLDGAGPKLIWPINAIARAMIRRMVRKNWYPKIKVSAPKFMQPGGDGSGPATVDFESAVARGKAQVGPTVTTRAFGTLMTADWRGMQLLHAAHHLAFLKPK